MKFFRYAFNEVRLEVWGFWVTLRRFFLLTFRPGYVRRMLARRRGVCGGHGCCDMQWIHKIIFRRCTDPCDRKRCSKWPNLPELCRIYPFDEKDKTPRSRAVCNFYWDDEPDGRETGSGDEASRRPGSDAP